MSGGPARAPRGRRRATARSTAYDLLHLVGSQGAYANLALPGLLLDAGLDDRDAALATELGYGTLRWRGLHDAVLAACVDRPLERLDPRLLDVLRLGAHQVLILRIPDHAAVAESVDLARAVVGEGPARLANAVMRRVASRDRADWIASVAPALDVDPVGHLATARSHPRWIVTALHEALVAAGGRGWDETRELLDADNEPVRPALVARAIPVADLLALPGVDPGRWSPRAGILASGQPQALAPVRDGRAGVQDEGSQLVALALAAAPLDGPDERWADLCAGPGGKAALLAALAAERGASLTAIEARAHRARLVEAALRAVRGDHTVICADATAAGLAGLDRVLVDAPCTGLGSLRRRPEARWRRTPGDLAALGPLQRGLLAAGLDAVRPGGIVAYATCSPHRAETALVVGDVVAGRDDAEILDAASALAAGSGGDVEGCADGPYAQLWPHRHGTDGMFLALLRRRGR